MYIPNRYLDTDQERVLTFMRRNSFATVVSVRDGSPVASHLPLSVSGDPGEITIRAHFAKANPHWQVVIESECMIIFTGPHTYISPKLYDRHESVPTWNYVSVHAYGTARLTDDAETLAGLHGLFEQNDGAYREQWDSLSDAYREGMLRGIVGFEVRVTRVEGAAKLSQNRTASEQVRIADHLLASNEQSERETGAEMKERM